MCQVMQLVLFARSVSGHAFTYCMTMLQAAAQRVGSAGAETSSQPTATGRLHAGLAAGLFTAAPPDTPEDVSDLKGGAVSRYETSPPSTSAKRASLRRLRHRPG